MTKCFLVFFYCSLYGLAPIHNFYVSTTSVRYVPNENSFQITTQVFLDDFESALRLYANENISLTPDGSQVKIDSLIEDYFRKNIIFNAKGEKMNFDFLEIFRIRPKILFFMIFHHLCSIFVVKSSPRPLYNLIG